MYDKEDKEPSLVPRQFPPPILYSLEHAKTDGEMLQSQCVQYCVRGRNVFQHIILEVIYVPDEVWGQDYLYTSMAAVSFSFVF